MYFSRDHATSRRIAAALAGAVALTAFAVPAGATSHHAVAARSTAPHVTVTWLKGVTSPGTPTKYDKVGILKFGPSTAKNVLVLEPGTLAGAAYFAPLAKWITSTTPGWQVWSVERRENLLEDQSYLDKYKAKTISSQQLFDYYLGYLVKSGISPHYKALSNTATAYAKQWGMAVAVGDLHNVILKAKALGGKVVLGGHSLGGTVVTAYATWNFAGKPGAAGLSGLVYIDGGSGTTAIDGPTATSDLATLNASTASPWLSFGGIPAPYAGLFVMTGSATALEDPNGASAGQSSGLLPSALRPPVPATNAGQFGYALNTASSPPGFAAAQAHLGTGLASVGPPYGWNGAGALTPLSRFASMFEGAGFKGADGSEWYFPARLTLDSGAIQNGNANAAQSVLGLKANLGSKLPKTLKILAFAGALFSTSEITTTEALAAQSGIPSGNLTLLDEHATYAHNDPAGAYPVNDFKSALGPFLTSIAK